MILRDQLKQAYAELRAAHIETPERDVRKLASVAFDIALDRMTLMSDYSPSPEQIEKFDTFILQRLSRKPVARIIGRRQFWGREFEISPDVLDPRGDTETVILEALKQPAKHVLDLGTGSGVLAITLLSEWPEAKGLASDISKAALEMAQKNSAIYGLQTRLKFCTSNWFDAISGHFDLIVSNPPYIAESELPDLSPEVSCFDPRIALSPGKDGLAAYRVIAQNARNHLMPDGRIIVEIGSAQAAAVSEIFTQNGYHEIECLKDLDGKDRVIAAKTRKCI